jgi:prepilin-type N-terminal cleavage/methylation domain-containing protein
MGSNTGRQFGAGQDTGEDAFTLIELMVVVLIIGILVGISVPVYLNSQRSAKGASAKSDARNVISEVQAYYTANNVLPTRAQLEPAGQQILQGEPLQDLTFDTATALLASQPVPEGVYFTRSDNVYGVWSTVLAYQGGICYKASFNGSETRYSKGSGNVGACNLNPPLAGSSW